MELNLSEPGQSRYLRVYEYYKELIVSGQMKPGAKLPSIPPLFVKTMAWTNARHLSLRIR